MSPEARQQDLRGFSWPLVALQRKLEVRADQARARLASSQREASTHERTLQATRQHGAQQEAVAASAWRLGVDPQAHAQSLRYLVQVRCRVIREQTEQDALLAGVAEERSACAGIEVQLACLEQVREQAVRAFRLQQQRRQAKEADLAWLGERQRRIAATRWPPGDAP
jgi:hypothetical protein